MMARSLANRRPAALVAGLAVVGLVLGAAMAGETRAGVDRSTEGGGLRPVALGAPRSHVSRPRADAPAAGTFLIATRQLASPIFAQTVILLLDYGEGGALGLIINRPTSLPLASVLPHDEALRERVDPIYVGGPVVADGMMLLIRSDEMPTDSRRVVGDVFVTGSSRALHAALEEKLPPNRFHAYVGYSGWAPGQLDAEIARGDWYVAAASPDLVFTDAVSETWPSLIGQYEGIQVRAPALFPATARRSPARAQRVRPPTARAPVRR